MLGKRGVTDGSGGVVNREESWGGVVWVLVMKKRAKY